MINVLCQYIRPNIGCQVVVVGSQKTDHESGQRNSTDVDDRQHIQDCDSKFFVSQCIERQIQDNTFFKASGVGG